MLQGQEEIVTTPDLSKLICALCADEYDGAEGDLCECGAEVCSDACMVEHQDKECDVSAERWG